MPRDHAAVVGSNSSQSPGFNPVAVAFASADRQWTKAPSREESPANSPRLGYSRLVQLLKSLRGQNELNDVAVPMVHFMEGSIEN